MSAASEEFEKIIYEIESLIKSSNAIVKWNDRIKDPDSPKQTRQIDISITEGGFITHVECRIHSSPQDVKWVEELIGRKISLGIDAIIGVSSSGFTHPAIVKAEKHGIVLRDLRNLTRNEVASWGKGFEAHLFYVEMESINIQFKCNQSSYHREVGKEELFQYLDQNPFLYEFILVPLENELKKYFGPNRLSFPKEKLVARYPIGFDARKMIFGVSVEQIDIEILYFQCKEVTYSVSDAQLYGHPTQPTLHRDISVQKMTEIDWVLIDTPRGGKMKLDLILLPHPKNSIILGVRISNGTPDREYEITVGVPDHRDRLLMVDNITISIGNKLINVI